MTRLVAGRTHISIKDLSPGDFFWIGQPKNGRLCICVKGEDGVGRGHVELFGGTAGTAWFSEGVNMYTNLTEAVCENKKVRLR